MISAQLYAPADATLWYGTSMVNVPNCFLRMQGYSACILMIKRCHEIKMIVHSDSVFTPTAASLLLF